MYTYMQSYNSKYPVTLNECIQLSSAHMEIVACVTTPFPRFFVLGLETRLHVINGPRPSLALFILYHCLHKLKGEDWE